MKGLIIPNIVLTIFGGYTVSVYIHVSVIFSFSKRANYLGIWFGFLNLHWNESAVCF